jgi:hypothetical protein
VHADGSALPPPAGIGIHQAGSVVVVVVGAVVVVGGSVVGGTVVVTGAVVGGTVAGTVVDVVVVVVGVLFESERVTRRAMTTAAMAMITTMTISVVPVIGPGFFFSSGGVPGCSGGGF